MPAKNIVLLEEPSSQKALELLRELSHEVETQFDLIQSPDPEINFSSIDGVVLAQPYSELTVFYVTKAHSESIPILSLDGFQDAILQALAKEAVSLAIPLGDSSTVKHQNLAGELVPCPADDFVTDRLNKVISTTGKTKSEILPAFKEFLEMA